MLNIQDIQNWNLSEQAKSGVIKYVERLAEKQLPAIFDVQTLSQYSKIQSSFISRVYSYPDLFYRVFQIPKAAGGYRVIEAPKPSLLYLQRWIKSNIIDFIPVSPFAHAYAKMRNIKSNAEMHRGRDYVLKLDIQAFYPSTKLSAVKDQFLGLGYSEQASSLLARLCIFDGHLPHGAPTSPGLSNAVLSKFDFDLASQLKSDEVYTRYADDITISSNSDSVFEHSKTVARALQRHGYLINLEKIGKLSKNTKKIITGIEVAEDGLKVPFRFKKKIRRHVHFISKYGTSNHLENCSSLSSLSYIDKVGFLFSLRGKIAFVSFVEGLDEEYGNAASEIDTFLAGLA